MDSQPFLSVGVSVIAGIAVAVLVEIFVFLAGRIRRKNEITYIRRFIKEIESGVKKIEGAQDGMYRKPQAQFLYFESQLKVAEMIISARSSHLSSDQSFEILKIVRQRADFVAFLSSAAKGKYPEEKFYDMFFDQVRELEWLKF